jgi:enoyl-CoA hydratase
MAHTCFDLEIDHHVAHVRMKRPDALNTMTRAFYRELPEIVRGLDAEAKARVVVLSSTGKHFTAGMDLSVFTGEGFAPPKSAEVGRVRETLRHTVLELQDSFNALEQVRMPVLAAIQGGCVGGGVDLVSACDMRYCTQDAFFVIQEINVGMVADLGTLQRLPRLMPQGMVRELAYTGRRLPASRALALGLVNEVWDDHAAMLAGVMQIAREIAERTPLGVCGSKESLNYSRDHSIADGLQQIATWQTGMFQGTDMMEAFAAKAEKRTPAFEDLLPLKKFSSV